MTDNEEKSLSGRDYASEIVELIRSDVSPETLKDALENYHESDIAEAVENLETDERLKLYRILGNETVSEVFAHFDDAKEFVDELPSEKVADIIEEMDALDASDVLDELDEEKRKEIIGLLDEETASDLKLIDKFDESQIGSRMTTNFITVPRSASVKEATKSVIEQAAENDNISTIYVTDENGCYCGAISLSDLIVARPQTPLSDIIAAEYPCLYADEQISDCVESLREYYEDSIPLLDRNNRVIGVITSSELVDVAADEIEEDYAKFAGLTEQDDAEETLATGIKKRLPWLAILMVLGFLVSGLITGFSGIINALPLLVGFQSLILDMSGNVGTQSLAVTIRALAGETTPREKLRLVFRELRIGAVNGAIIGTVTTLACSVYIRFVAGSGYGVTTYLGALSVAACVGIALLIAMTVASLSGTLIPLFFKKIKVDPAVASGPLITTLNDMIAATVYYGTAYLLLLAR